MLNKYMAPPTHSQKQTPKKQPRVHQEVVPIDHDEPRDEIQRELSDDEAPRKDYNNPAKTMGEDHPAIAGKKTYNVKAPRVVKPTKENYDLYARHFPGTSLEAIQRTFQATTQYGTRGITPGFHMKHRLKAPNPALTIPRRNEPVATDTIYGPRGVSAVDNGSTAAQFFIGRKSKHRWIKGCGNSDGSFVKVLYDCITKFGAMDVLISDRAKAEISAKVKDLQRALFIDSWQSEPHNKNQNFGERGWQDTQAKANNVLNWSGAPDECWLLVLEFVCFIQNHTALKSLNWRTPWEWLTGVTPDITILLLFLFYEPVYYALEDSKAGSSKFGKPQEAMGRFVGYSENVGHQLTFKVLTNDKKIVHRARIRSANKEGAYDNYRARMAADKIRPARAAIHSKDVYRKPTVKEEVVPETVAEGEDASDTPSTNPDAEEIPSLLPKTSKKRWTPRRREKRRNQRRAKMAETSTDNASAGEQGEDQATASDDSPGEDQAPASDDSPHDGTEDIPEPRDSESQWQWIQRVVRPREEGIHQAKDDRPMPTINPTSLINRSYITNPDDEGEQLRAVIEEITPLGETTSDQSEQLLKFRAKAGEKVYEEVLTYNRMLEWCDRDLDKDDFFNFKGILGHRKVKNKWEVLVDWERAEKDWQPLSLIFGDNPVTVSMYAKKNGLLREWPQCRRYTKNRKTMSRMAHQAKLKNFRQQPRYKFGIQVPRNHDEAMMIDTRNGNTAWRDSERLETKQLFDYDSFRDLGKGAPVPEGYTKIKCHFVYDVKHDGRLKSRFVAGGHMTDTPVESVYSGVVSIPGIRMVTFLAELNDLELWATDIGNAYLESVTKEKVCFVAGPEFGELEGHLFIIYKAQYGLKSSGK